MGYFRQASFVLAREALVISFRVILLRIVDGELRTDRREFWAQDSDSLVGLIATGCCETVQ